MSAAHIVKRCACGATYSEAAWNALPAPAAGGESFDDLNHYVYSARQCVCGSTLGRTHCSRCAREVHEPGDHSCNDENCTDCGEPGCHASDRLECV